MGSSSGCGLGSDPGGDPVRARLGVAGGLSDGTSVFGQCRDAGTEGAVLGDGGPGVTVRLEAGEAGRGCEGVAGERGLVGDGGADRQGCLDRVCRVRSDDHGAGDFVAEGVGGGGLVFDGWESGSELLQHEGEDGGGGEVCVGFGGWERWWWRNVHRF
jgi:hypothetical protein